MWFEEALFYLSANGKGVVVLGQEVRESFNFQAKVKASSRSIDDDAHKEKEL